MKQSLDNYLDNINKFGSLPIVFYRTDEEKKLLGELLANFNESADSMKSEVFNKAENNEKILTKKVKDDIVQREDNSTIQTMINTCSRCDGGLEKKYPVGECENGIFVILNAPMLMSKFEIYEYRNKANQMIKNIFEKVLEVDIDKIYITNIIKCESDSLINKPSTLFQNCERILKAELDKYLPHTVLVMGDIVPLKRLVNKYKEIQWFSIDHPVTMVKHPELKSKAFNTLKLVKDAIGDKE